MDRHHEAEGVATAVVEAMALQPTHRAAGKLASLPSRRHEAVYV